MHNMRAWPVATTHWMGNVPQMQRWVFCARRGQTNVLFVSQRHIHERYWRTEVLALPNRQVRACKERGAQLMRWLQSRPCVTEQERLHCVRSGPICQSCYGKALRALSSWYDTGKVGTASVQSLWTWQDGALSRGALHGVCRRALLERL